MSCFILFLIFISYFYVVTGACVIMLCCRTRYTTHTCYDTCGSAPYLSRSSCSLAGLFLRHFTELQTVFLSSFFFFLFLICFLFLFSGFCYVVFSYPLRYIHGTCAVEVLLCFFSEAPHMRSLYSILTPKPNFLSRLKVQLNYSIKKKTCSGCTKQ